MDDTASATRGSSADCVFNVVWTGAVFAYLKYFVCSLIRHSDARFRFVANGCTPESIDEMERFADLHSDAIVEVLDVSSEMVAHGVALDEVLRIRDDGELFCLVDADIRASAPFLDLFTSELASCAAVTSGREVWNDDNVVPAGALGVGGRHFFDGDGFVFGSPHLALYRRAALDETTARWKVGFGSAGPDLSSEAASAVESLGHPYRVYDTGKLVNILLQFDGERVEHVEHPDLMHIGGMSHFLAPPAYVVREPGGEPEPDWVRYHGMNDRYEVARFTATVLREMVDGNEPPAVPTGLSPSLEGRLRPVRDAIIDLVATHRAC